MFIYVHVPFCVSRCIYCDFYVTLEKYGGQDAYVDALCREIDLRFSAPENRAAISPVETIYFGGGTPSLLKAEDYRRILDCFKSYAPFSESVEITFEANPGGRKETMKSPPEAYLEAGFNRISVGVQSLRDDELKKLSRVHTAEEAEEFVRDLQRAGWRNISIDLMYAVPGQTRDSWRETLQRAAALGVQHVSMYGLKVEEGTPLDRLQDGYGLPDDEANVAMYFDALEFLKSQGYERYEFSNLSLPGYASRHNLNYWNNSEYWAFGPSAHGYLNNMRYENVRDLQAYLQNPLQGEAQFCPPEERLENALIFGLRKAEGVEIAAVEREYGIDFGKKYARLLEKFLTSRKNQPPMLLIENGRLKFSERAIPLSNHVLAEFLQ